MLSTHPPDGLGTSLRALVPAQAFWSTIPVRISTTSLRCCRPIDVGREATPARHQPEPVRYSLPLAPSMGLDFTSRNAIIRPLGAPSTHLYGCIPSLPVQEKLGIAPYSFYGNFRGSFCC